MQSIPTGEIAMIIALLKPKNKTKELKEKNIIDKKKKNKKKKTTSMAKMCMYTCTNIDRHWYVCTNKCFIHSLYYHKSYMEKRSKNKKNKYINIYSIPKIIWTCGWAWLTPNELICRHKNYRRRKGQNVMHCDIKRETKHRQYSNIHERIASGSSINIYESISS